MASRFGKTLSLTVFGQSHSPAIGCVLEGLPSGITVDPQALATFMARRAPKGGAFSTPRIEKDAVRIVSGLNEKGQTAGAPLALIIENTNTKSSDYDSLQSVPRPGHADFTAWAKWHGRQDIPGGGHFSGRLTATLAAAGFIALQILEQKGIRIAAHIAELGGVMDVPFDANDETTLNKQFLYLQKNSDFPVLNADAARTMQETLEQARSDKDSLGGVIEFAALGMPKGVGEPMFDGIDSLLARAFFAIPAVKGVDIGAGFGAARMRGSENNDPYGMVDGAALPLSNHAGGILGGISTGAPIISRVAFKPISSIGKEQKSVDLSTGEDVHIRVEGRHDPSACIRAVPVVEAVGALVLLDCILSYPAEEN